VATFTPEQDFIGAVTPVPYVIVNSYGEKAHALINITVTAPPPPVVEPPVIEAPVTNVELADTGFDQLQLFVAGVLFLVFGTALLTGSRLGRFQVTGN
jgi:hypothetical protein